MKIYNILNNMFGQFNYPIKGELVVKNEENVPQFVFDAYIPYAKSIEADNIICIQSPIVITSKTEEVATFVFSKDLFQPYYKWDFTGKIKNGNDYNVFYITNGIGKFSGGIEMSFDVDSSNITGEFIPLMKDGHMFEVCLTKEED